METVKLSPSSASVWKKKVLDFFITCPKKFTVKVGVNIPTWCLQPAGKRESLLEVLAHGRLFLRAALLQPQPCLETFQQISSYFFPLSLSLSRLKRFAGGTNKSRGSFFTAPLTDNCLSDPLSLNGDPSVRARVLI